MSVHFKVKFHDTISKTYYTESLIVAYIDIILPMQREFMVYWPGLLKENVVHRFLRK